MDDRGYTFFMEDSAGVRATFDMEFCKDETSAIEHARHLLRRRPHYCAIEVFDGQKSVRVERSTG